MPNSKKKSKVSNAGRNNDLDENIDNMEKENPTDIGPGITERYKEA